MRKGERRARIPIPSAAILARLEKQERARLLLGIARMIRKGAKPQRFDSYQALMELWPGMFPEAGDTPDEE